MSALLQVTAEEEELFLWRGVCVVLYALNDIIVCVHLCTSHITLVNTGIIFIFT